MDSVVVYGFVAAVLGGLDSPAGAVVGGLVLGLSLSFVSGYVGVRAGRPRGAGDPDAGAHPAARRPVRPGRRSGGSDARPAARPAGGTRSSPGTSCSPWPAALVVVLVLETVDDFRSLQLASMAYLGIAAGGLTVLTGLNGQISLGHGALMAIGAYTTALLLPDREASMPLPVVVLAAIVVDAGRGHGRGRGRRPAARPLPGRRHPGPGRRRARHRPLLRGAGSAASRGSRVVLPDIPEWVLDTAFFVTGSELTRSRYVAYLGVVHADRHLRAAGQPRRAAGSAGAGGPSATTGSPAELAGIDLGRARVSAFMVSAAAAGAAGAMMAVTVRLAAPSGFTLTLSLTLLTAVVLGGLGSLAGALVGAALLTFLPQLVTDIGRDAGLTDIKAAELAPLVYGLVMIAVILLAPTGLAGITREPAAPDARPRPAVATRSTQPRRHVHLEGNSIMRDTAADDRPRWPASPRPRCCSPSCGAGETRPRRRRGRRWRLRRRRHRRLGQRRRPLPADRRRGARLQRDPDRRAGVLRLRQRPAAASTAARSSTSSRTTATTRPTPARSPTSWCSRTRSSRWSAALGTPTHSAVVDFLNDEGVPDMFVSSGSLQWGDDVENRPLHVRLAARLRDRGQDHRPVRRREHARRQGRAVPAGRRLRRGRRAGRAPVPRRPDRRGRALHLRQHRRGAADRRPPGGQGRPGARRSTPRRTPRSASWSRSSSATSRSGTTATSAPTRSSSARCCRASPRVPSRATPPRWTA